MPTAKRTPNIRYIALGFTFFMDHVAAKTKPELISARNAAQSRVATYVRSFSNSAATLYLPLFRLTLLRVCADEAPLLFVLGGGEICVLWVRTFEFAVRTTRLNTRAHQCS